MSLLHSILSIYLLLSTIQSLLPTHTCTHSIACVHAHIHSHMYTDTHKCTYRHIMVHLPQRRHSTYFLFLPFSFFLSLKLTCKILFLYGSISSSYLSLNSAHLHFLSCESESVCRMKSKRWPLTGKCPSGSDNLPHFYIF